MQKVARIGFSLGRRLLVAVVGARSFNHTSSSALRIAYGWRKPLVRRVIEHDPARHRPLQVFRILQHEVESQLRPIVCQLEFLDQVLLCARRDTKLVAVDVVGEMRRVDNEGITFPPADRITWPSSDKMPTVRTS